MCPGINNNFSSCCGFGAQENTPKVQFSVVRPNYYIILKAKKKKKRKRTSLNNK